MVLVLALTMDVCRRLCGWLCRSLWMLSILVGHLVFILDQKLFIVFFLFAIPSILHSLHIFRRLLFLDGVWFHSQFYQLGFLYARLTRFSVIILRLQVTVGLLMFEILLGLGLIVLTLLWLICSFLLDTVPTNILQISSFLRRLSILYMFELMLFLSFRFHPRFFLLNFLLSFLFTLSFNLLHLLFEGSSFSFLLFFQLLLSLKSFFNESLALFLFLYPLSLLFLLEPLQFLFLPYPLLLKQLVVTSP